MEQVCVGQCDSSSFLISAEITSQAHFYVFRKTLFNFLENCLKKKKLSYTKYMLFKAAYYHTPPLLLHAFSYLPAVGWKTAELFSHPLFDPFHTSPPLSLSPPVFSSVLLAGSLNPSVTCSGMALESFWMRSSNIYKKKDKLYFSFYSCFTSIISPQSPLLLCCTILLLN